MAASYRIVYVVPNATDQRDQARTREDATVTTTEQETTQDTAEQAEFRAEVRAFLEANAEPKGEASMWAVNFHTDAADAARDFERGRAWQRTLFDNHLAGLTY